jgi:hypothetical protein
MIAAVSALADAGVACVKVGLFSGAKRADCIRRCRHNGLRAMRSGTREDAVVCGSKALLTALMIVLGMLSVPAIATAQDRSAAIFDFELTDTSRDNQLAPHSAELRTRLVEVSERLRKRLAESGSFVIVDIAPVASEAEASNLQSCGGCDITLASKVGADLAITGSVYKMSNLILRMMILVRDARTGAVLALAQASMRGDTDESWMRTLDWLVVHRLLAPDYGVRR